MISMCAAGSGDRSGIKFGRGSDAAGRSVIPPLTVAHQAAGMPLQDPARQKHPKCL